MALKIKIFKKDICSVRERPLSAPKDHVGVVLVDEYTCIGYGNGKVVAEPEVTGVTLWTSPGIECVLVYILTERIQSMNGYNTSKTLNPRLS